MIVNKRTVSVTLERGIVVRGSARDLFVLLQILKVIPGAPA